MRWLLTIVVVLVCFACRQKERPPESVGIDQPSLMVLGVAQDAGYPQADCRKQCCAEAWTQPKNQRYPVSLALFSPQEKKTWLIECTPAFTDQWQMAQEVAPSHELAGIALTHAHIGHYAGLMYLGREVMGADMVPVNAMPRMRAFLEGHGPWEQLIRLGNIEIQPVYADSAFWLGEHFKLTPFLVPHRDEYSETVAYLIEGPEQTVLFLPDIDKWHLWKRDIRSLIGTVDIAFLDATFFDGDELPGRDMSEIPHPFVVESMDFFSALPDSLRSRIHFIHFNHTNPLLEVNSLATDTVKKSGYNTARQGRLIPM